MIILTRKKQDEILKRIAATYVFYGGEYGLDKDYCVFGIEPIKEEK